MTFDERMSDSVYIERVWSSRSHGGGPFISVAAGRLELVLTTLPGLNMVTLRGPETRATTVDCPPGGSWSAIRFRPGVYVPRHPTARLVDLRDVHLPVDVAGTFALAGRRWRISEFEDAEVFADRLVRCGFLALDGTVAAIAGGAVHSAQPLTQRSVQRHFRLATGLTPGRFRQIERAREATGLLRSGVAVLDVVHEVGYFDQPHLSHAMRMFVGQTPAGVQRGDAQLSFLYKTTA